MKIQVFDQTGKKSSSIEVNPKDFGSTVNETLLAQAIRAYEHNSHQRTSKVKNRGEITGSTRKIYRQKGTGRARHGDRYAPIFVGGGVSHGPVGIKGKNLLLPKRMKRKALAHALLSKLNTDSVSLITSLEKFPASTKEAATLLNKIANHPKNKTLIITTDHPDSLYRGTKNIQNVTIRRSALVNTYDIIYSDHIVLDKDSLSSIKSRLHPTQATLLEGKPTTKSSDTGITK